MRTYGAPFVIALGALYVTHWPKDLEDTVLVIERVLLRIKILASEHRVKLHEVHT